MTMPTPSVFAPRRANPRQATGQRGVAGIEFGLTIMLFLMLFFAIIAYGAMFWVQQTLSQAAGEGARAALLASQQGLPAPGAVACLTARRSVGWLDASPGGSADLSCVSDGPLACGPANCFAITVSYNADAWPLIATMRQMAGLFASADQQDTWIPRSLRARAVVQIFPESS